MLHLVTIQNAILKWTCLTYQISHQNYSPKMSVGELSPAFIIHKMYFARDPLYGSLFKCISFYV